MFDQGCGDPIGYCTQVQSSCNRLPLQPSSPSSGESMYFCGCDGNTYAGICPTVPFAHTGPCP
jgi:hypothetical protein